MRLDTLKKILLLITVLYVFTFSIQLMSSSFKLMGEGFAQTLIETTANPIVGLLIGILTTSIIQSSSTTTSIVVGCVAGGVLTLQGAIPIIMGANIGTTITNTIVSIGHVTRQNEFQRAFAASVVHDFFNIMAVLIIFPLEMAFHFLEKISVGLADAFEGIGGMEFLSPLKLITEPLINLVQSILPVPFLIVIVSLALLFFSLIQLVRIMRSLLVSQIEIFLDKYLFKNDATAFLLALIITSIIQSSSITTSLIVPLVGAGMLTVRRIFPYTLGANVGTTVTAMMASLASLNPVAVSFRRFPEESVS
ncbi:MAG: Na/Pi symporter, partial [Acidobacteriota bacterium]